MTTPDFPYADILDKERPRSVSHPPSPRADRAVQFAAFAALTGYGDAVNETARLTDHRPEITEDMKNVLDMKLCEIESREGSQPEVILTVYEPDLHKSGGRIVSVSGRVRRIDQALRTIELTDRRSYKIDDVYGIRIP